jgi:hypothetical protein
MLLNMSVFQHKIMIINRSDFYFFECMIFVIKSIVVHSTRNHVLRVIKF